MAEAKSLLAFLDANVFIEAVLVQSPPAVSIFHLAAHNVLRLVTCKLVIEDIEEALLDKATQTKGGIEGLITVCDRLLQRSNLQVVPDPSSSLVISIKKQYLASMRHLADIPVLAAAIQTKPDLILSGNRKHFNDQVAFKCGIPIYSCTEFLTHLAQL